MKQFVTVFAVLLMAIVLVVALGCNTKKESLVAPQATVGQSVQAGVITTYEVRQPDGSVLQIWRRNLVPNVIYSKYGTCVLDYPTSQYGPPRPGHGYVGDTSGGSCNWN